MLDLLDGFWSKNDTAGMDQEMPAESICSDRYRYVTLAETISSRRDAVIWAVASPRIYLFLADNPTSKLHHAACVHGPIGDAMDPSVKLGAIG